jgi:hypothetical protein
VTRDAAACPACNASPISGRYCRECGFALNSEPLTPDSETPDATRATQPAAAATSAPQPTRTEYHPPSPAAANGRPQTPPDCQQPPPSAANQHLGQIPDAQAAQPNGWGQFSAAPPPAWPPPQWIPVPSYPSPRRHSTALAVGAAVAILVALLAITATIILLVASGGSNHTGILTQSTTPGSRSEQPAAP